MTGLHILGLMGASEAPALRSALRASEGWSQATRATELCLHFSHSSKYFAFTLWLPDFPEVSTALPWSTECSPQNTFLLRAGERLVSPQPWGLVWHPGLQGLVYPFCTLKELQVVTGGAGRPLESQGRTMLPSPCWSINLSSASLCGWGNLKPQEGTGFAEVQGRTSRGHERTRIRSSDFQPGSSS